MKLAVFSGEPYPVHDVIRECLQLRGHRLVPDGAFATDREDDPGQVRAVRLWNHAMLSRRGHSPR